MWKKRRNLEHVQGKDPNSGLATEAAAALYNTLELLMMGIVVPETCWASNKICNKNLCCIQLAFYFHIFHVFCSLCTAPSFLSDFNWTWNCSIDFRKIFEYRNSLKSFQWETSCCLRPNGQTDRRIVVFRNFANAPKKFDILNAGCFLHCHFVPVTLRWMGLRWLSLRTD